MSLEKDFGYLQIPLEDVISATDGFSDENFIRQGGFGKIYRGKLSKSGKSIDIVARRLDPKFRQGKKEFWTEISMLSSLKHINLVSIVGYCDEKDEMIIINKYEANGSLDKYLNDPTTLTWKQRLRICVGVVNALSYIHYDKGRDFSVIHRNIKSSKILLDGNWEPKLSGFELSLKNARDRRHRLFLAHPSGTYGYVDPKYVKTGGLTHKSDVFSLGVVLFEVLCGRRAFIPVPNMHLKEGTVDDPDLKGHPSFDNIAAQTLSAGPVSFNPVFVKSAGYQVTGLSTGAWNSAGQVPNLSDTYPDYMSEGEFPEQSSAVQRMDMVTLAIFELLRKPNEGKGLLFQLAKSHYEDGKLDDIIHPGLRKQMDSQSLKIFSEAAYCCLKDQRAQRPNIYQIASALEKALQHQCIHEKPEHPVAAVQATTNRWKGNNLDHLKIELHNIELATNNFSNSYCIGSGGYGMVFKAELEHFDNKNSKGENNCELPKVRSTVAIKRIFKREDAQGEQGFIAEIETLSTCKHPNIVSLLGFCDEGPHMILVYELAANGSLEDYLGSTSKITNFIPWVQRLKICIDVSHGLNYLHTSLEDKQNIIHRDLKSANILLNENWGAMIADFGLSRFHQGNQLASTLNTKILVGTEVYWDPEYEKKGRLKKASDIYSLGVVLFEILCGRLAYDQIYMEDNDRGLAPIARRRFREKTLNEMIDPKLKEEIDDENILSRGLNQDSFDTFSKIAYQCLAETQAQRPTMEVIIKELKKALYFQENHKDKLQISLDDIKLMTQNFSRDNVIGRGGFGTVYKGEATHVNGRTEIAAKRLNNNYGQGDTEFLREIEILLEYKQENVIGLVGYCNDIDERIIVYEYACKGSLDKWLNHDGLTWMKRLDICIDIASGLEFLHGTTVDKQDVVIHRDIKCSNILLNGDWKAKISDFGLALVSSTTKEMDDYIIDNAVGTPGYVDPLYVSTGFLTKESDIYSFGVVLFEILCGRLAYSYNNQSYQTQVPLFKRHHEQGKVYEMVFEGIKQEIVPQSLAIFSDIAYQCLDDKREDRPAAKDVIIQLKKALEFQVDYEIWEPKLPKDYKEIIQMSKSPEVCSTKKKQDLYNILSHGILLQKGKLLLSFNDNGEKNTMISATTFSYRNLCPHKWRSLPESRFHKAAEMLDISNLMIKIKTKTQFLSPNTIYGIHLVFKFCDSTDISSKPMHVNYLKYKKGSEPLHAYFATWRDKEWMMIELYRFLNRSEEDVVFKFLLESLSTINFANDAIYVEGIEFRAIDKVEHEEVKKLHEVRHVVKSKSNVDQVQQSPTKYAEQLLSLSEVNGKKHIMLSAKAALRNFNDQKLFKSKLSAESRFEEVIELLPQQVFRINCTIKSQKLSGDTEYVCYLVFKLSEECQGLHCPVEVRDLLHRENNEAAIIYFVAPSPWNVHHITRVPEQREDGWMEVHVWKFNSNHGVKNDCIPVNLKFISYEGIMSGLIVCGLEFRPM